MESLLTQRARKKMPSQDDAMKCIRKSLPPISLPGRWVAAYFIPISYQNERLNHKYVYALSFHPASHGLVKPKEEIWL